MKQRRRKQYSSLAATVQRICVISVAGLLLLAVLHCTSSVCVAAEHDDDHQKFFRTGFIQRVFSNIDLRDARAVLELHSREVSRLIGMKDLTPKVVMFTDMDAMTDALRKGELEMAAIPSLDFLRVRNSIPLIPAFVGVGTYGQGVQYVLITRKDNGIRSFSDLRGKSVMLPPTHKNDSSRIWLDVLLMKEGRGARDAFFGQVREGPKVSAAVMGVFFRQVDSAIVTRGVLDTSSQLNPQIGIQLGVLAESPILSDSIVCLLPGTSEKLRKNIYQAMLTLNGSKSGKQIYTIFQTNGITPFKPEYLEGFEQLLREYKHLKEKILMRK